MEKKQGELFKKLFGLSLDDVTALGKAEKEYEQLLADEHEEVIRYAAAHGWKSTRHERGAELRAIISEIEARRKF
jgi:hypothetical protein